MLGFLLRIFSGSGSGSSSGSGVSLGLGVAFLAVFLTASFLTVGFLSVVRFFAARFFLGCFWLEGCGCRVIFVSSSAVSFGSGGVVSSVSFFAVFFDRAGGLRGCFSGREVGRFWAGGG